MGASLVTSCACACPRGASSGSPSESRASGAATCVSLKASTPAVKRVVPRSGTLILNAVEPRYNKNNKFQNSVCYIETCCLALKSIFEVASFWCDGDVQIKGVYTHQK